jgi:hypothetical protein
MTRAGQAVGAPPDAGGVELGFVVHRQSLVALSIVPYYYIRVTIQYAAHE